MGVRVGQRRVRIKRSDLDRLIEAGYTGRRSTRPPSVGPDVWDGEFSPTEASDR